MAAAISSQREISIHSDRREGRTLNGDKEVSEVTLKSLAGFILDNNYELNFNKQMLRNLRITPLTCDEIKFGIRLINDHPLIAVVENKENKNRSGGISVTMERTLSVRELHQIGIAADSGLALGSLEAGSSIKIITVSQQAFDALNRYKSQLERRESYSLRSVYVAPEYPKREEHRLLHRERSCCEKISRCVDRICCEKISRCVSSVFSRHREFIAKCCMFFCGVGFFSAIVVLGYNLIKNTRDIAGIDPG